MGILQTFLKSMHLKKKNNKKNLCITEVALQIYHGLHGEIYSIANALCMRDNPGEEDNLLRE